METRHPKYASLELNREDAELLIRLIGKRQALQKVVKEIQDQLAPIYVYKIKCQDCPRVYEHFRKTPDLTEEQAKKGGICSNCMEDYK